jgi:hypothetical protein
VMTLVADHAVPDGGRLHLVDETAADRVLSQMIVVADHAPLAVGVVVVGHTLPHVRLVATVAAGVRAPVHAVRVMTQKKRGGARLQSGGVASVEAEVDHVHAHPLLVAMAAVTAVVTVAVVVMMIRKDAVAVGIATRTAREMPSVPMACHPLLTPLNLMPPPGKSWSCVSWHYSPS